MPTKSACPGRGTIKGSTSLSFQLFQSLLIIFKAIGPPVVLLFTTPEEINTSSFSMFILPPEPRLFCLLDKKLSMYSFVIMKLDGIPSKIAVSSGP